MKNNFSHRLIAYFCIGISAIVLMLTACRKENEPTFSSSVTAPSVQNAQQWFERYQKINKIAYKLDGTASGTIVPQWDKAQTFGDRLELPFTVDEKHIIPSLSKDKKYPGISRLVITQKTGGYSAFIYLFAPSDRFKGDIQKVSLSTFRDDQFSGIIRVHAINGQRIDAFAVENGKVTAKLAAQHSNGLGVSSRNPCYEFTIFNCDWDGCNFGFVEIECPVDDGTGGCPDECECYPSLCDPCNANPVLPGCEDYYEPPCPLPCNAGGPIGADAGTVTFGSEGTASYGVFIDVNDCQARDFSAPYLVYNPYMGNSPGTFESLDHACSVAATEPNDPNHAECGFNVLVSYFANAVYTPPSGAPTAQEVSGATFIYVQ